MEVQIISKEDDKVQVNTAFGCFVGIWCSSDPVISKRYVVELDSDEVLTVDAVRRSDSCVPYIECVDHIINVTGFVEDIQDGVMVLRIQKSIIMLEISSDFDFTQYLGQYICIKLNEIKLYDTGIY